MGSCTPGGLVGKWKKGKRCEKLGEDNKKNIEWKTGLNNNLLLEISGSRPLAKSEDSNTT